MIRRNLPKDDSQNFLGTKPGISSVSVAGMNWTEEAERELLTIRVSGTIDLQHSPRLRQLLHEKVRLKAPAILLDFNEVKYIDSSGLATLVEYFRKSRGYSGLLTLAGLNGRVRSIFELARLGEVFKIFPTATEAREALLRIAQN